MKKIISIILLMIIGMYLIQNTVLAISKTSLIQLDANEKIDTNLEIYDGKEWNRWEPTNVYYTVMGKSYPAYNYISQISNIDEIGYETVTDNNLLWDEITWRTIINGFPYKTKEQIGVETDEDAYLATKAAVYCLTIGRTSNIFRGPTQKEEKIIKAIDNLIHIGFGGTQTQKKVTLELKKDGEFEISGEYFSQAYTVDSNVEVGSYEVINVEKLPEGSLVTNMDGKEQKEFTGKEKFKVMIPISKLEKDWNEEIIISAKCKTYPIYKGRNIDVEHQNYIMTYNDYELKGAGYILQAPKNIEEFLETNKPETSEKVEEKPDASENGDNKQEILDKEENKPETSEKEEKPTTSEKGDNKQEIVDKEENKPETSEKEESKPEISEKDDNKQEILGKEENNPETSENGESKPDDSKKEEKQQNIVEQTKEKVQFKDNAKEIVKKENITQIKKKLPKTGF